MKKLLLGLGTLASVAAPVAAVVACGSSTPEAKFVDPSDTQKPALEALATSILTDDAKAAGLTEKEVKVKGDTVQITLSKPTTPAGTADAPDAPEIVGARYTADLSTKVLTSVEYKNEGESFVAVSDTDLATLKGTIDAHVATAVTAIKDAEDAALTTAKTAAIAKLGAITDLPADAKTTATAAINAATDQTGIDTALAVAHAAATPAPVQGGHSGSTADIDQDAVDAEQAIVNKLAPSVITDTSLISNGKLEKTDFSLNTTFAKPFATSLGLTGFSPKGEFTYTLSGVTDTTISITVGSGADGTVKGTPSPITLVFPTTGAPAGQPAAGNAGNPSGTDAGKTVVPGAGPAKVSADNAKIYTGTATTNALAADGTATVIITISGDDFENHISGETAQAIEALLTGTKTSADVKKVELIVSDGTTKVSYTVAVGTTGTANQNLNAAINAASREIADANLLDHDVAFDATGAQTAMETKLNAITERGFAGANEILKALGNATKFTDASHIQVVFGKPIVIHNTPAQRLTSMLDARVLGTFSDDLKKAITDAIAKLG